MKNIKNCFQWNEKFPYDEDYEDDTKYIAHFINNKYGKVLCDLVTLCELWMDFSDEEYSAQFIRPDSISIDEFVSWAKAKEEEE